MRETENLEFIAVGPWGVPSPCVRTSRVLCRKTVCGPRSTGRFLYSLTLRPLPLSHCRVPCTDDCVECVRRTGSSAPRRKAGKFHEILKAGLKLHCNYTVITLHL